MSKEDDFAAIAQAIADGGAPAIGLARVKPEGGVSLPVGAIPFSIPTMVDLIVQNPSWSHKQLGEVFGRSASWIAQVLAMQVFQDALEPRRHEVLNPEYAMTLDERFKALTIRSLTVLQEKLENGKALPDMTIIKTAELGIKALGMGQKQKEEDKPQESQQNSSEAVAEKIMAAMNKRRAESAVDVEVKEVPNG